MSLKINLGEILEAGLFDLRLLGGQQAEQLGVVPERLHRVEVSLVCGLSLVASHPLPQVAGDGEGLARLGGEKLVLPELFGVLLPISTGDLPQPVRRGKIGERL